jgi:hypothetical protein
MKVARGLCQMEHLLSPLNNRRAGVALECFRTSKSIQTFQIGRGRSHFLPSEVSRPSK